MSICPTCKLDAKQAVKIAYKLGMDEAEQKLQKEINTLKDSHHHLFDEIIRIEQDDPKYGIMISAKMAEKIITLLKKHTCSKVIPKKLSKLLKSEDFKTLEKLKDYIENV